MNVRPLNEKKYEISKYRFRELYYHCLQYEEWREELKSIDLTQRQLDGMPHGSGISDPTASLAARRDELYRKCQQIEQAAIAADPDIYDYIILAVTQEGITYNYLSTHKGIPCGKDMYYDRRRKFYSILSDLKNN